MIPSQRVILGAGLAILLIITAASIGLDVKSRSDAAWVNHTVEALKKISDVRLLLRQAESAARGFEIYRTSSFADEFRATQDRIVPTLADLERAVRDNRDQAELVKTTVPLVRRRFDIAAEAMRLRAADDQAGIAALQGKAERPRSDGRDRGQSRPVGHRGRETAGRPPRRIPAAPASSCSASM